MAKPCESLMTTEAYAAVTACVRRGANDLGHDRTPPLTYVCASRSASGSAEPNRCRYACGDLYCPGRSEEHTSELQSLMRISYAVFCLKKKSITYFRLLITPYVIID